MSKSATAQQVRSYFTDSAKGEGRQAKVVKRAGEKVGTAALKCLGSNARGRLHPAIIAEYNSTHSGAKYGTGNTNEAIASAKASRVALREQARQAGFPVGPKGPLPKAFLATLKGGK